MAASFLIKVNTTSNNPGRLMKVTMHTGDGLTAAGFMPVDVRDIKARVESQALPEVATVDAGPLVLMADMQMRDCVRSVWMNATTEWRDGRMVNPGGEPLPAGFPIDVETPATWNRAGITPSKDDGRAE